MCDVLAERAAGLSLPFVTWHIGDDMLRYAFDVLGTQRVEFETSALNLTSRAVKSRSEGLLA